MVLDTSIKWNDDIEIVVNFYIYSICVSICKCCIYFCSTENYFPTRNWKLWYEESIKFSVQTLVIQPHLLYSFSKYTDIQNLNKNI